MGDKIRLFQLPFSFMLPQTVAAERGYFEDAGLEVELVERERANVDWKYIPADETLTGAHDVDLYPICKWESIKRTWDMDDGQVVAKGTFADQPYTVFTRPDSAVETPADLADVPVGVNIRTGQEYTARRALEEHVPADAVELEHHGMPTDRLAALRDGEVAAVSLLEPHTTLASHLGFEPVLSFENHMGIVGAASVDDDILAKYLRGYERAVEAINADPDAFREQYLAMLEDDLSVAPDLFAAVDLDGIREEIAVPTYETPERADREELHRHLSWMKRRDLIDPDADIDAIVASI